MGTLTAKINKSIETKEAIRQAIIDKGVDVPANTVFSDYPEKINAIEVGTSSGGGGTVMDSFYNARTNNGTDYSYLFNQCSSTSLDLSNWNTSKVTNMSNMFSICKSLASLNLSNWDTSNVIDMKWMFNSCESLTSLDLSNFDTSNVTDIKYIFRGCSLLTTLDIRNFDLAKCTSNNSYSNMFYNCTSLHTLRLDNCSNDTINKIITSNGFPTEAIDGVTRTIYCKQANATGLTAPTNWVFSYV